ncbi:SRPBCC domain-containing protein [Neobacillus cucumis]|uniref:CoxG family protein n=1 Tax=Neobacillus cucumis TaxID=1740721 RepID=UPI00203DD7F8|nr:SRPBCC domain-containing protein [Neobacillus cucumis]MCM3727003.1 SRPBCC domain-containing protein [Neobacillus cucumis]
MEIEYQYHFSLPRSVVWKYIKNERVLKNALPGCRSFSMVSNNIYKAEMDIHIGPIQDLFTLEIRLDEDQAPSLIELHIKGNGNMGQLNGQALLMLKENQGTTMLSCKANGQVTGALGLAGKRILDSSANKGLENFFQILEKEIKRRIYELKRRNR